MNTASSASGRSLLHRRPVLFSRGLPVLFLALALVGCATLAPGEDPVVVRTEQTLEASLTVYDAGMTWCKANTQHLTPAAAQVAETIRTAFPPAYRSLDSALQLYKAGKRKDLLAETDEIRRLIEQLLLIVKLAGGPDLTGTKASKDVSLLRHADRIYSGAEMVRVPAVRYSTVMSPDGYFDGCNWHRPLPFGGELVTSMGCGYSAVTLVDSSLTSTLENKVTVIDGKLVAITDGRPE